MKARLRRLAIRHLGLYATQHPLAITGNVITVVDGPVDLDLVAAQMFASRIRVVDGVSVTLNPDGWYSIGPKNG